MACCILSSGTQGGSNLPISLFLLPLTPLLFTSRWTSNVRKEGEENERVELRERGVRFLFVIANIA